MNDLEKEIEMDLHKIVMELKKTKSINRAYRLICSLRNLEDLINDNKLDVKFPKEYEYEINKFDVSKMDEIFTYNYYVNALNMREYNKKLCNMADYFENKYFIDDYFTYYDKVKLEDMVLIVNDFFKEYDSDIYKFYVEHIAGKRSYVLDLDIEGYSFFANYVTEPYTFISTHNILEQAVTIAHETIHSYLSTKNKYITIDQDINCFVNNFEEVYSTFIEIILMDYLEKIKYMPKNLEVTKKLHSTQVVKYLKTFKENSYMDRNSESYAYGYVLAYHFYNQYLKNKDEAKDNIYNFMLESYNKDKLYLLNNFGLSQDDIINPKYIEKQMSKSLIKIPKN